MTIQKGTRVLISLWDSLMFGRVPGGRVPGTRPNMSESHSEISTRVPFCIAAGIGRRPHAVGAAQRTARRPGPAALPRRCQPPRGGCLELSSPNTVGALDLQKRNALAQYTENEELNTAYARTPWSGYWRLHALFVLLNTRPPGGGPRGAGVPRPRTTAQAATPCRSARISRTTRRAPSKACPEQNPRPALCGAHSY